MILSLTAVALLAAEPVALDERQPPLVKAPTAAPLVQATPRPGAATRSASVTAAYAAPQEFVRDAHRGTWALSAAGLFATGGTSTGLGGVAGAQLRRWSWCSLDLEGGALSMAQSAGPLTLLLQTRVWLAGLFRVWFPVGLVRFEVAAGPAALAVVQATRVAGSETGVSTAGGLGLTGNAGVAVALGPVDLFARGFGQLSGGSTTPTSQTIWVAGAMAGAQLRFE